MSTENNINEQQGMGFGKSMAVIFGITAVVIAAIVGLKFLIG